jgi:hypothetical protein
MLVLLRPPGHCTYRKLELGELGEVCKALFVTLMRFTVQEGLTSHILKQF